MRKFKLGCIASGSGSDFGSVTDAFLAGSLEMIDSVFLISTDKNAGCLKRYDRDIVPQEIVHAAGYESAAYNYAIADILKKRDIDIVFLVGCIKKIFPIPGIDIYNIHPAHPKWHGGDNMYGLAVHVHVLDFINDLIYRGKAKIMDQHFTQPTVHEVTDEKYDDGHKILQQDVEIPAQIILDYVACKKEQRANRKKLMRDTNQMSNFEMFSLPFEFKRLLLDDEKKQIAIAERLQKHVLPYEHLMLPGAVNMAARRRMDNGS